MRSDSWVAIDSTTDRRAWARVLARGRDQVLSGGRPPKHLRDVIVGSWRRCNSEGLDADTGLAPVAIGADQAAERWGRHPVSSVLPAIREITAGARSEGQQVLLFCDVDGTLLWLDGDAGVVDEAQSVHLQPGAVWSERAAGTNAMGTALAVGHPVQVFSAEHFARAVGNWTCSAAPVRDPATGQLLGVLDLSGEIGTAHPHSLAAVTAAARLAEASLRAVAAQAAAVGRTAHGSAVAASRVGSAKPRKRPSCGVLRVGVLGTDRATVAVGRGAPSAFSRRHSEILALLALRPEGWTAEQLAIELLGDFGKPVSVRAEMSRLRRRLGVRLDAQPYRLTGRATFDFLDVERLLASGGVARALERYAGEMLPFSEVGLIVETRRRIELSLRAAVLADGTAELLGRWVRCPSGRDDAAAWEALLQGLEPGDARRPAAITRLQALTG